MTKKYDDFMAEFKALLKKHDLYMDFGYDEVSIVNGYEPDDIWLDDIVSDDTKD
jgi:hypothetical protein